MAKLFFHRLVEKEFDMDNLNGLEISILVRLSYKYPNIKQHIPFIRVLNREVTGVGMYVNFYYIQPNRNFLPLEIFNGSISTNEIIEIEGLKHGLGYEVDISDGMIKFIEFVTYGEEWKGELINYKFS
jgi:hypothetical protein